jgi:hypothetical protein
MRMIALVRTVALATALTAVCVIAQHAWAQQQSAAPEPAQPISEAHATPVYYDEYQPSRRKRLRREASCREDENENGAYCVKKCDKDYVATDDVRSPLCRSVDPLPPGSRPTVVRVQTGKQPLPSDTPVYEAAPPPPRAGEKSP